MKYKIGFITSYSRMAADLGDLPEFADCELIFRLGVMEYAIDLAIKMEKELQVDAFISTEVTSEIIKKYVNVPVIPLHIKGYNLIEAFFRARRLGESIAFADIAHQTSVYDFQRVADIMGYKVSHYKFDHPDEAPDLVNRIVEDNHDVIVTTAGCTLSLARKKGLHTVLIEPLRHDIIEAINTTRNVIAVQKKEIEKSNWLNAVIDNINEGIITVDNNNQITSVNSFMQRMLRVEKSEIVGKQIDETVNRIFLIKKLLSVTGDFEVIKYGKNDLVVSKKEIFSGDSCLGSVYKVEALQDIQQIEMEVRKKSLTSGFVASNTFDDIIGVSAAITEAKQKAQRFALTGSNIFINGESGSGKEIFAQSIHNHSACKNGPFVAINCTTLPEQLLDSELFGFDEGAFTGAKKGGKAGLFELAHNGTLFLDEIGEMPPLLQAKLLRVLQERVVRRVGGSKNIPINVRVVFATNKDLLAAVKDGSFREDLYYRINVLNLQIPPLRERKEDIPIIAQHFIQHLGGARIISGEISEKTLSNLMQYDWHGNVRELYNFVERAVALSPEGNYDPKVAETVLRDMIENSKKGLHSTEITANGYEDDQIIVPLDTMRNMQNAIIMHLHKQYAGDKKKIESVLDMSNTTLWRRFKDLGV